MLRNTDNCSNWSTQWLWVRRSLYRSIQKAMTYSQTCEEGPEVVLATFHPLIPHSPSRPLPAHSSVQAASWLTYHLLPMTEPWKRNSPEVPRKHSAFSCPSHSVHAPSLPASPFSYLLQSHFLHGKPIFQDLFKGHFFLSCPGSPQSPTNQSLLWALRAQHSFVYHTAMQLLWTRNTFHLSLLLQDFAQYRAHKKIFKKCLPKKKY